MVLGQADDRARAEAVIRKYQDLDAALASLQETRRWWLSLMDTVRAQTSKPEFDRYLDWLKYQALAERIWARRGFYQASGAYGFRDQLQDSVNLIWMDPYWRGGRSCCTRRSSSSRGTWCTGSIASRMAGPASSGGRTPRTISSGWSGEWSSIVGATGDDSLLEERAGYLGVGAAVSAPARGKAGDGV